MSFERTSFMFSSKVGISLGLILYTKISVTYSCRAAISKPRPRPRPRPNMAGGIKAVESAPIYKISQSSQQPQPVYIDYCIGRQDLHYSMPQLLEALETSAT